MSPSSLAHESWSRGSIEARQRHVVWRWLIHFHFLPLKNDLTTLSQPKSSWHWLRYLHQLWASWPSSGSGLSGCRNMGGGRGEHFNMAAGRRISVKGTSYLFEVFDPSCIIFWQVYTKSYKMTFSWWKGVKALRTCKTPRILRAYRMVSKPTQDWKTVGKSSWWWGGQKIFLLFGKRRPSTEVKQWMLRSMCDDSPHKIFTHHGSNRSHNKTQHNDPNNRAEQISIPFETNPR